MVGNPEVIAGAAPECTRQLVPLPADLPDFAHQVKDVFEVRTPAAAEVFDPPALKETIQAIRRNVREHFHLREMRDPELTVRTNRRAYVIPRQLAMYITRQLTEASLEEIGREFGGRHHTTVLHAINKIEELRSSDEVLDRTITRLIDTFRPCVPVRESRRDAARGSPHLGRKFPAC